MPISLMGYALNKNFIAENLCENRFRQETHCAGTCYLNKQLARANNSQDTQDRQGTVKILIIDFFESVSQPQFGCSRLSATHSPVLNTQFRTENFRDHLFRPPIA